MILAGALILTAICVILVIYPYVIYPLILKLVPSREIKRQEGHKLSATLVFCATMKHARCRKSSPISRC